MSRVSMFLGARKFVSTLHFPVGSHKLPFEAREAVCLLEMSPSRPRLIPSRMGTSAFAPCVPSFPLYNHGCSPPYGLKLHNAFPSRLSHPALCICPLSPVSIHADGYRLPSGESPFLAFQSAVCWENPSLRVFTWLSSDEGCQRLLSRVSMFCRVEAVGFDLRSCRSCEFGLPHSIFF